ncbi:4Fe-4S binding protein [Desulfosporosinus lacus]|uniref:Pyruvate ferredoxin oxidoreductase delta subunit n=1 Tax=Desulfosporosinus lacus DSM 15449 TaxID=1121420 RepID=A0A1M6C5Y0_9FIRM|nr:4Fe-4S binding protein [Desulfosporosinus lacus]SHI56201.1 pyruvate ferredoxin oxidoreductase delta subunit [Desulfosporosinus lacus DSM 15449]
MVKNLPVVPTAKAGSLVETPTGITWRIQHPEILENCNMCLDCTLFCPDGAIVQQAGELVLSLRLCKGCGICANECKENAIQMIPEYSGVKGVFR